MSSKEVPTQGLVLPTPLALARNRVDVSPARSQERFDAALFLAEALIKFSTVTGLSYLAPSDADFAARTARELVRADGIGTWVRAHSYKSGAFKRDIGTSEAE